MNPETLRFHVYRDTNPAEDGTASVDFTGSKFVGHKEGDEHRTFIEIDNPNAAVQAAVNEFGTAFNKMMAIIKTEEPAAVAAFAALLGLGGSGPVGVRVGFWDKKSPAGE